MPRRSAPRWSEVRRFAGPALRPARGSRASRAQSVQDLRELAERRTPRAVLDYVEGAAEGEVSLQRSTRAFDEVTFHPHVLRDVSTVDPSTTVLGAHAALPVVLGPTGFTRMMHAEGEPAVARAAGRGGVPYVLSTMGTTSVEELTRQAPDTDRWFQLYLWKDRGRSAELVARAHEAGYRTLVLTVDVPVAGRRLRDAHHGLSIPPTLTRGSLLDMARHPRWLADALTTPPLAFESLGTAAQLQTLINSVFEPALTLDDVAWLRETWAGSIVVKGVLRSDDAKDAVAAGADAVAVSNHGGRQLDRAATPLRVLSDVVDAIGDEAEVYLDGGVRSGADVAAAVALGAAAVFVARPYLWALMAGGEAGVDRLMVLLMEEYRRTLALLGVTRTADLSRDLVSL